MTTVPLTATFTTAGTFTWTCPAGVTAVVVACTAAGGGGGAAKAATGSNGGGGGGGEAALQPALAVTPGTVYTGTVGAAGAAGTSGGNGGTGGDTSFAGDTTTVYAHGGTGGTAGTATGAGQNGLGGNGSTNFSSGAGGNGDDGTPATNGGGGGGAGGVDTSQGWPGFSASGSTAGAASGGAFSGGAGGAGSTSGASTGTAGSSPGGGGGGALSTGTGRAGGAGAGGQVVITWTMTDPVTLRANTGGGSYTFTAPYGATAVTAQAWGAGAGGYNTGGGGSTATGIAGATVWQVYGAPQVNRPTVAGIFDGYVGRPMAVQAQKIFFNETGGDSIAGYQNVNQPQQIGLLAATGCYVVLCVKPNRTFAQAGGTDDFTALQSALADIQSNVGTTNMAVVLWMECNLNDKSGVLDFATSADYLAYYDHYVPAVPSDVPVYLNVGMAIEARAVQFIQAVAASAVRTPDAVGVDWYDSSAHSGVYLTYATSNPKYPGVFDAIDTAGLPAGVYEWGQSASASYPPSNPDPNWNTYINGPNGLLTVIQARITAGSPVSHVMYYGGAGPGNNDIESNTDFRIASLRAVNDLMAGTGAVGGAGGGGGEFAQESSLAITDSHTYAVVVGDGGDSIAGGNSSIAGDSVTVTAHGGGASASTGTGGGGGTGSSNTAHYNGGAGGAGGITNGGGGGGGGSGGTSGAGNAGGAGTASAGGSGGAAVTGGGKGGFGSAPGTNGFGGLSPGGGGGGGGGGSQLTGSGSDGQITLSSFVTHPAGPGSLSLAPVAFSGTGSVHISSFALAPLAFSGAALTTAFKHVQDGSAQAGGANVTVTLTAGSTAGSLLVAAVVQTSQQAITGPAGWLQAAAQNTGGAAGRLEIWYLTGNLNPGGITSAIFSTSSGTGSRGFMSEFTSPAGTTPAVSTSGTASGTTGVTSFPVSSAGSAAAADLDFAAFLDEFSSAPSGNSWTAPSGWTQARTPATSGVTDQYSGYWKTGLTPGTQSVTGAYTTSASQTGWAAGLASFTAVPAVTCTGAIGLSPLALSGAGNSAVSAGSIATSGGLALAPLAFQSPSQQVTFPASPLPIMVEILINGVWTDISDYVYQRDAISISGRGRPNEASTPQATQTTLTLNNRDGSFSPQNTSGQFYPYLTRNTQIRISVATAVTPRGAWYSGYRFWGEVPAWPVLWDPTGSDVYCSITAAGVLQRMAQSQATGSPIARYYTQELLGFSSGTGQSSALAPVAYWPCEDGTAAAFFASGLSGGSPMIWSGGTPGLAADSDVPGSNPFAQLNGTTWTGAPGDFTAGGITYTTPGTYTWICPGNVTTIKAECWGSGGGGGNGVNGAGGAGGEYAAEPALAVTPGNSYTLTVAAGGSGGAGSFSTNGLGGSNGSTSTFVGDAKTVRAHGGQGGPAHASGGSAAGGTGSSNATHHNGGAGAPTADHFGGCGGGSSAGNASAGNAGASSSGTAGGAGGNAVTDGGPGGAGGNGALASQGNTGTPGFMPVPGPGGGGGGGGFNGGDNYAKPGGGGQSGQVTISFGSTPAPPAIVLRGILDIPATGGINGAYSLQMLAAGTIADLHIKYATGGDLQLIGKNSGGSTLISSGSVSFGADGQPLLVSAELTQATASTIKWKLTAITPNATSVVATASGSVSGTLGAATQVTVNNASPIDTGATGVGHVSLQYAVDPILNLAPAFGAYAGELAATRFLRLCGEQNVPVVLTGNLADTPQMGYQVDGLLVDLLQDCENTDLGQMYETRDSFGLGYVTRLAMQNQVVGCTLDYSLNQLAQGLAPTDDDVLTRNDIIATRANGSGTGSSYEVTDTTDAMSIQDPPNGVGLYSYAVTVNVYTDTQLAAFAQWLLALGTVDEFRYPVITIDLSRAAVSDGTFSAAASLDITSFLQIINPPSWLPPGPVNQLCFGFTETLNAYIWTIAINAVPEDPYSYPPGSPPPTW